MRSHAVLAVLAGSACGRIGFDTDACLGAAEPTVFAANLDRPFHVAADATTLYWTETTAVMACSLAGCGDQPTALASNQATPGGIAVHAGVVYWANNGDGTVVSCPAAGCGSPTPIATGQDVPDAVFVDDQNVYWTDVGNTSNGSVMSCALGGCGGNPTQLAAAQPFLSGIVAAAGNVYWTTYYTGTVMACAIAGCGGQPTAIASAQYDPAEIAADAVNVYRRNLDGAVQRCALGGCDAPLQIGSGAPVGEDTGDVAVDAGTVYWTTYDPNGSLHARRSDAGAPSTALACGVYWPRRIAVTPTAIFLTSYYGGTILQLAR